MNRPWVPLLILLSGIAVLAWPEESNEMVVSLNQNHGPSVVDVIGIALIMCGYLPLAFRVIMNFRTVKKRLGNVNVMLLISLIVFGHVGITAGLILTSEWLLWTSVAISCLGNYVLILHAYGQEQVPS